MCGLKLHQIWTRIGQTKITSIILAEILRHFNTMGNHCLLVFTGESSFCGLSGDAEFRPSGWGWGWGQQLGWPVCSHRWTPRLAHDWDRVREVPEEGQCLAIKCWVGDMDGGGGAPCLAGFGREAKRNTNAFWKVTRKQDRPKWMKVLAQPSF